MIAYDDVVLKVVGENPANDIQTSKKGINVFLVVKDLWSMMAGGLDVCMYGSFDLQTLRWKPSLNQVPTYMKI